MFVRQIVAALCLAVDVFAAQPAPILPSKDPWYKAPVGFEHKPPGTVLRLRAARGNLTSIYGNSSSAWNILYRTTDSHYQPTWAVTTLFTPKKNHTKHSMVSYQIPYNSPNVDGSPSFQLYSADFSSFLIGDDIQNLLSNGWFVNVPDFEGPLASFLCGVTEGHATIDSIRAVKSLRESWAPAKDVNVAMWGYSGGAIASEYGAELQVQYAPELEIAGMALGGLPTNGSTTFPLSLGGPLAGLVPAGFVGLAEQYPEWNKTLIASLKQTGPFNASNFLSVRSLTSSETAARFDGQDTTQYFKQGAAIFADPTLNRVLDREWRMGYHGVPQMPTFVYMAIKDELNSINETDALVDRFCGVGVNILYQRNSIGGHAAEAVNGDASALGWLRDVLGGTYKHTGCTVQNVAQNITDSPL